MDPDADPCDDFYQYACGGFLKREIIPDGWPSLNSIARLNSNIQSSIRGSIGKPILKTDIEPVKNVKVWYKACKKDDTFDQLDLKPFVKVADELGGIPAVDSTRQPVAWNELLGRLREFNFDILVSLSVGIDPRDPTRYILQLDQSDLHLPDRGSYLKGPNTTELREYVDYGVKLLSRFPGANIDTLRTAMEDVVKFETAVAKLMRSRDVDANSYGLTLREMKRKMPGVDWLTFVNRFFPDDPVTEDEEVLNNAIDYIRHLIAEINRTPPETVSNYLMMRFITTQMTNFNWTFPFDDQADHRKTTEEARSRSCVSYLQTNMGAIVDRVYIDDSFNMSTLGDVTLITVDLMVSFKEMFDQNKWMDAKAKSASKEKVGSMRELLGYPQLLFDDALLDSRYKEYKFNDSEAYFDNVLRILKLKAKEGFSLLHREVDKTEWDLTATTADATYNPTKNTITFPAGILQPPFYNPQYSMSLKYGAIGTVIGHEIVHGFDNEGRNYDKDGNKRTWWSRATSRQFEQHAAGIVDQYSSYLVEGTNLTINGKLTLAENIADNGGIQAAFKAYQTWVQTNDIEPVLPGVPFTHDQLFFIGFAQMQCRKSRPESIVESLLSDVHSPAKYRVIGPLSNLEYFPKAYNCSTTSKMNPNKKNVIW